MKHFRKVCSVLLAVLMVAVMLPTFIAFESPVEAAEPGVIVNGGFDTYESYTNSTGGTAYRAEGWTVREWGPTMGASGQSGKGCQLSKDGSHTGATFLTQVVPVNTNATYTFSFYAKAAKTDCAYVACFTYSLDLGLTSGSCTTSVVSEATVDCGSSSWKQFTVEVETGNNKYLQIRFHGTGVGSGDSYLDTVALTTVSAGDTGTHAAPTLKSFATDLNRPASDSDNIIVQPGFESTTNAQWNVNTFITGPVSRVTGDSEGAHSGSAYLKYYRGSVALTEWPKFQITCPTAGEYVFSAWVRTPELGTEGNTDAVASIGVLDRDTGKFLTYSKVKDGDEQYYGHMSTPEIQIRSTATDNDWHLRSVTFYVGADNSNIEIAMYGLKSTMYVDDISVHLLSKGVKYEGDQKGALSASTSNITNKYCESDASLIPDSAFNSDVSENFWTKAASGWNNGFLEINKDAQNTSRGDALHYKATGPESNKKYRYIKFVSVEPNTSYTVSFDYRVVSAGNNLMFIDNNIERPATFHTPSLGSAGNSWKTYAFTFSTGNYNRIGIVFQDGYGEAYYDDFRFFKTSDGISTEPEEELFPTLKHNVINGKKEDVLTQITEDGTGLQGYGLAFKFKLECDGAQWNADTWVADFTNAKIDAFEDGTSYTLKRVGAVMTNKESVGTDEKAFTLDNLSNDNTVINVPVKYLWEDPADNGYITHIMRIINIPETHLSTLIYARPYYVFDYNGREVIMYGDIVSECYEEYPDINDGWLEWD